MRKQKGITLISLIITIILLLILVGASLGIILQGNFFYKARRTAKMAGEKIQNQDNTIEQGQNDWEQMEMDICSHIWGEEQIILEPTCTTPGKKVRECENCKRLIEIEMPALGHDYENRVCTRCGEEEPGCAVHTYGDWVVTKEKTCLEDGSRKRTCTVCGVEQVEIIKSTGTHTYGDWVVTKAATCLEDGSRKRTCMVCGVIQTEVIAKTGHNYVNRTCTKCGDIEALVIGANIDYHEYLSESGSTVSASYTSTRSTRCSTINSEDADAVFSIVNNSGIQWIVLGEENGQIKITTKTTVKPVTGGYYSKQDLKLFGQNGYTNFVDELNKIGAVFGKGKYADTTKFSSTGGRSFKMEDLGYDNLTRTPGNTYTNAATGAATVDFDYYMALDASTSTVEGQHTWKALSSTNKSVTLYYYTYNGTQTLSTDVSSAGADYWLASRSIYCRNETEAVYKARYVTSSGTASSSTLFYSYGNYATEWHGFRPVVYLKTTVKLSNYSSTSGYTLSY